MAHGPPARDSPVCRHGSTGPASAGAVKTLGAFTKKAGRGVTWKTCCI